MLTGKMGVNLRGGDVGMTQQLLNHPEVSPTSQHVSSKAVSQRVGGNLTLQTS